MKNRFYGENSKASLGHAVFQVTYQKSSERKCLSEIGLGSEVTSDMDQHLGITEGMAEVNQGVNDYQFY